MDLTRHAAADAFIEFEDDDDVVRWSHQELLEKAARVAARLDAEPEPHREPVSDRSAGEPRAAVIVDGKPSIEWLLSALGALLCGRPVIAFPETLADAEVEASLPVLPFAWAVSEGPSRWPSVRVISTAAIRSIADQVDRRCVLRRPSAGAATDGIELRFDVVAYTSGTTSASALKCFRMTHESTEVFAAEFVRRFTLRPGDTWAVCHSFSHVVHFEYVIACLLYGINIRIVPGPDLIRAMRGVAPSAAVTVPAVYESLARHLENRLSASAMQVRIWRAASRLPDRVLASRLHRSLLTRLLPSVRRETGGRLKVLILGAAASPHTLKRRLSALGLPVYEAYGLSELGMVACQDLGTIRLGSVGRPWPGVEVRLTDDGQLLVRSLVPRTSGYLESRAGAPPFLKENGWCATGDLARLDTRGNLVIVGRKKATIITNRGENVNPQAVEARLGGIPQVLDAVAYGDGKPYLSAVVFLEAAGPEVTPHELAKADASAPEHERVRRLVQVRTLPSIDNGLITRSGKLRRDAVLALYGDELARGYER